VSGSADINVPGTVGFQFSRGLPKFSFSFGAPSDWFSWLSYISRTSRFKPYHH
jgi:hypothetical protein